MNEPEKIYARVTAGRLYASRTPKKLFGEELPEYIRKDSLLEWAKQKQYESTTIVADNFWQEVIDKINTL